jgi:hypothetical protein
MIRSTHRYCHHHMYFFLLFLVGCQTLPFFNPQKETFISKNPTQGEFFCRQSPQKAPQLFGANIEIQREFLQFISPLLKKKHISFREMISLWALAQFKARPDLASPTARWQFLLKEQDEVQIFDFFHPQIQTSAIFPVFQGIEIVLQGQSSSSLTKLLAQFDAYFNKPTIMTNELYLQLLPHREKMRLNAELKSFYFRGDDFLQPGESLLFPPLRPLLKTYNSKAVLGPPMVLEPYEKIPDSQIACNYDLNLYDRSVFLIDSEETAGHPFGLIYQDKIFFGYFTQNIFHPPETSLPNIPGTPWIAGQSATRSAAFCKLKNPQQEIWLLGLESRDPGQHLHHLFRYGLASIQTNSELKNLLSHSRHLFLSNPLRLIIEATRSRPEQIQELLKMNLPIYNASDLGHLAAYAKLQNIHSFFLDDRKQGSLTCSP